MFHPIGIVLKGSGFYKTEARSASKEASSKKEQVTKKASEPAPSGEKHEKSA